MGRAERAREICDSNIRSRESALGVTAHGVPQQPARYARFRMQVTNML
jgi:hypothetical protein